jgi:hypothetical protein
MWHATAGGPSDDPVAANSKPLRIKNKPRLLLLQIYAEKPTAPNTRKKARDMPASLSNQRLQGRRSSPQRPMRLRRLLTSRLPDCPQAGSRSHRGTCGRLAGAECAFPRPGPPSHSVWARRSVASFSACSALAPLAGASSQRPLVSGFSLHTGQGQVAAHSLPADSCWIVRQRRAGDQFASCSSAVLY